MTANELIKLLKEWPTDLEVIVYADGQEFIPKRVTMEQGGVSSWLEIDCSMSKPPM